MADDTYVQRNKLLAINWRNISPKRRSALSKYTENNSENAKMRRS